MVESTRRISDGACFIEFMRCFHIDILRELS